MHPHGLVRASYGTCWRHHDIGFGSALTVEPEQLRGPDVLSLAEIEAAEVPTVLPLRSGPPVAV
jgi:hypothetical protein